MTASTDRAKSIFLNAVDLGSSAEREAYVAAQCAGDDGLRRDVNDLLGHHAELGGFLDMPAGTAEPGRDVERAGAVVGPYKLLQQIGEGGMGVVFMAEQSHPVRRKVALKVIKAGMDSRQVIARFEAERQALAIMDHVNIARVLDGGTTDSGLPYFVMELVNGVPITKYCDDNHLTPRERLELFDPVCQAIQHAHQKGIIHRDIKPSNVMITLYDGKPVAKVIDFGVAKATEQRLTERTLFTHYGAMVGTLEYMSPEQAEMSALAVDTRSDIYSLGVLLYELLTGSTPLTHQRLKEAAYGEVVRMIREEEPPKPSTRLSDSGKALASISAQRQMEPSKLAKLMRGELDWIVMKCLEKDRNRRYETASAIAADLQCYLADEPVLACPPSAGYRMRKFVSRNKGAVLAATAVAALLLAGIAGTTWQAMRAIQAEHQALALRDKSAANFLLAREAVDKYLNAVTDNPKLNEKDFFELRKELLETALPFYQKIAEERGNDAESEAARGKAYHRLALVRNTLGEKEAALADYDAMRAIFGKLAADFPDEPSYRFELARSHANRGTLLADLGKLEEAESEHRTALKFQEQLAHEFPGEPTYRWEFANNHAGLGLRLKDLGRLEEAEGAFRAGLTIQQDLAPSLNEPLHRFQLATSHNNLGIVLKALKKYDEAETVHLAARKIYEQLVAEFPKTPKYRSFLTMNLNNLANLWDSLNKTAEAEKAHHAAFVLHKQLVAEFPSVPEYRRDMAMSHYNLGGLLLQARRFDETELEYRAAIAIQERLAADFPGVAVYALDLALTYRNLGFLANKMGQAQASLEWTGKAIATVEPLLKLESRLVRARLCLSHAHKARAELLEEMARRDEAAKDWDRAIELAEGRWKSHYEHRRSLWRANSEVPGADPGVK